MPICACCGQTREVGEPRTVRTGVLTNRSESGVGTQQVVTYTYGDMVDHTFFVCSDCVRRDRTLRPLAYGVMGAGVLLLVVLSATLHQGWLYLAALVWLVAGAIMAERLFTIRGKLEKQALADRGANGMMDTRYVAIKPDHKARWNEPG